MKMVAATRLRRAQEAQKGALLYSSKLAELMSRLISSDDTLSDPFLRSPAQSRRALVLVFSSDRGLCGSFNNQVAKKVLSWTRENAGRFERVDVSFCGRRGFNALKNRVKVRRNYEGVTNKPTYADACAANAPGSRACASRLPARTWKARMSRKRWPPARPARSI